MYQFVFVLFLLINPDARADFQWKQVTVEFNDLETTIIEKASLDKTKSGECESYRDGQNISEGSYFEAIEAVSPLIELPGGNADLVPYLTSPSNAVSLKLAGANSEALYRVQSLKLILKKRALPISPNESEFYLTTEKGNGEIDVFIQMSTKEKVFVPSKFGACIATKKQTDGGDYTETDKKDCRAKAFSIEEKVKTLPLSQDILNSRYIDLQYALKRVACLNTEPKNPIVDLY